MPKPPYASLILIVAACHSTPSRPKPIAGVPTTADAAPRMIAVADGGGGLTIARVDRTHVEIVATDDDAGALFGWLDEHTLIAVGEPTEAGVTVTRLVDGERAERIVIAATEWPRPIFVELILVGHDQIWLSKCAPGVADCLERTYLRVSPGPRVPSDHPPTGAAMTRATNTPFDEPYPLPPDVAAAAGVTLRVEATQVVCTSGDERMGYPDATWDTMFEFLPRATRWVSTRPPIYELAYDIRNPADFIIPQRAYFRPCEAAPLDGYAWLGDDRWASFDEGRNTWTFHAGPQEIGTLEGAGLLR